MGCVNARTRTHARTHVRTYARTHVHCTARLHRSLRCCRWCQCQCQCQCQLLVLLLVLVLLVLLVLLLLLTVLLVLLVLLTVRRHRERVRVERAVGGHLSLAPHAPRATLRRCAPAAPFRSTPQTRAHARDVAAHTSMCMLGRVAWEGAQRALIIDTRLSAHSLAARAARDVARPPRRFVRRRKHERTRDVVAHTSMCMLGRVAWEGAQRAPKIDAPRRTLCAARTARTARTAAIRAAAASARVPSVAARTHVCLLGDVEREGAHVTRSGRIDHTVTRRARASLRTCSCSCSCSPMRCEKGRT
jgi:hypothetical protein